MPNPLIEVQKYGQSIWYDNIRRGLITSGELRDMVEKDGLLGVTSNPTIFEKAVSGSIDYDNAIQSLVAQGIGTSKNIYEKLAIEDIQMATDVLRPVYERTEGLDGYVSLEVSPYLAKDTEKTIEEARRLFAEVGRKNVLIKIPATPEGIPAVKQLLGEGININVTLLFSVETYEEVVQAYMEGLEKFASAGGEVRKIASVASFFISRIDSLIDQKLSQALDETQDSEKRSKLKSLLGKVAIANAKIAYDRFQKLYSSDRWKALDRKGARKQRLLWASTSTKNPKYPKTLYVDELIGPDTVNTIPTETFYAFRSQGRARPALTEDLAKSTQEAEKTMRTLEEVGISMNEVCSRLLDEGVMKFSNSFDNLLGAVEKKRQELLSGKLARQVYSLHEGEKAVQEVLAQWRAKGKVRQLWSGNTKLWSGTDENQWMGWLHVVDGQRDHPDQIRQIVEDIRGRKFKYALVLGMGGSSLCPAVMSQTFGKIDGFPELLVLDSTVPAQIRAIEGKIDFPHTLFIVSSKSGTTTEPNAFKQYFFDRLKEKVGAEKAGTQFIAITDPGSQLHKLAKVDRFRHIVHGVPSIGGRYSAMSNFGMVPAAIMGLDIPKFLDRTEIMVSSCASCVPPEVNPGVALGVIMGTLASQGRDKVTIAASPGIATLGSWLEQLLAESTGKEGKGLVPVDGEKLAPPEVYGKDRLFVYIRLNTSPSEKQDQAIDRLEKAGHPVVRISLEEPMDLGQEFFRWEMATAVAGSILGLNPFDQPDVEASKIATRKLTDSYEKTGKLPQETPVLEEGDLKLFADPRNAEAIGSQATSRTLEAWLVSHLGRIQEGDYFAVNAYVEMHEKNHQHLQTIRHAVRDAKEIATTLGFGPRFLHSTGQLHKGGPDTGVFLQITSEDAQDLSIPGQKYTFGILKRFQAQGDFEVLAERKRRALRIHLGPDVTAGLTRLAGIFTNILKGD